MTDNMTALSARICGDELLPEVRRWHPLASTASRLLAYRCSVDLSRYSAALTSCGMTSNHRVHTLIPSVVRHRSMYEYRRRYCIIEFGGSVRHKHRARVIHYRGTLDFNRIYEKGFVLALTCHVHKPLVYDMLRCCFSIVRQFPFNKRYGNLLLLSVVQGSVPFKLGCKFFEQFERKMELSVFAIFLLITDI